MSSLIGALHGYLQAAPTVMGKNIVEIAKENSSLRSAFKAGLHSQKKTGAGLSVLFGNLAQQGALFRASGLKDSWLAGSGPARVFNSEDAAVEAVRAKKIKKGDVLVVRYCGPRGRPGMPQLSTLPQVLQGAGLGDSVLLVTDGRLGRVGGVPAIVHVAPEAAVGSPLSIAQDGDMVFWNFNDKSLTLRLTETEIKVRLSRWKEQEKNMRNSFLYRYAKYSSSSAQGAVLA
jgi:dihydroxy-acid dehydratase